MFKQSIIVPKLDLTKLEVYIAAKESQNIIFNDNIEKDLEFPEYREYVESDEFMEALTEFVALNYLTRVADDNIKNNIFSVTSYLRNNKSFESAAERKEMIINLNELISTLNCSGDDNNITFYRNQFYRRTNQKRTDFWDRAYDKNFIEERKESLNYSISSDYAPIYDLIKVEDEQEFAQEVASDYLVTHFFLNTLNMLFEEMPSIYSDKRFVERAKLILKSNILLAKGKETDYELDEYDVIDVDLVPRTKKLLKNIKRISR